MLQYAHSTGAASAVQGHVLRPCGSQAATGPVYDVMDAAGRSKSATAAADGSYAVDASDLTAPLVLKASGARSGVMVNMVSVLDALSPSSANVVNITPLTTVIAAGLSSTGKAADLNPVSDRDRIVSSLASADAALQAQIAPMMQAIGISGSPIRTPFAANGSGYDKLYDHLWNRRRWRVGKLPGHDRRVWRIDRHLERQSADRSRWHFQRPATVAA